MLTEKKLRIGFVILSVLFLISLGFNIYYNQTDKKVTTDTTTIVKTKIDTITDSVPVIKHIKDIYVKRDTFTNIERIIDTITNTETVVVDVPIVQKTYSDDSTYTAYVSGYKPNLDSISVYRKEIIIEKTITTTKKDNKKFGIGPVLYGGYDIHNKQFGWGVGIGLNYNIIKF